MPRILHFGPGHFHRAHQAWYTHDANTHADDIWKISAVSLRSRDTIDALRDAEFEYVLAIQDGRKRSFHRINVHDAGFFAPDDPGEVLAHIRSPETKIISLTVSEKAYFLDNQGQLDLANTDIQDELSDGRPVSIIGYLAHGLAGRRTPVTILCCDNLSNNGRTLEAAVRDFAKQAGLDLPSNVSFPNSMVDRITPRATDALRAEVSAETGHSDALSVATEAFSEWVIEDRFMAGRPPWEEVGVVFTEDVAPFEMRKLRMLNATHSALAYGGLLRGHEFVHEAVEDPVLLALCSALFDEAAATLPAGIETQDYREALLARYRNSALQHRLDQIAMDGSQKLPVRILETLRGRKGDAPACRMVIGLWVAFAIFETNAGRKLNDPEAEEIRAACESGDGPHRLCKLLGLNDEELLQIDDLPVPFLTPP